MSDRRPACSTTPHASDSVTKTAPITIGVTRQPYAPISRAQATDLNDTGSDEENFNVRRVYSPVAVDIASNTAAIELNITLV